MALGNTWAGRVLDYTSHAWDAGIIMSYNTELLMLPKWSAGTSNCSRNSKLPHNSGIGFESDWHACFKRCTNQSHNALIVIPDRRLICEALNCVALWSTYRRPPVHCVVAMVTMVPVTMTRTTLYVMLFIVSQHTALDRELQCSYWLNCFHYY